METAKVVPFRQFIRRYPQALDLLLRDRENLFCRNRTSGKVKKVQLRALHQNNPRFWESPGSWEFFLDRAVAEHHIEALTKQTKGAPTARNAEEARSSDAIPPSQAPTPEHSTPAPPSGLSNFGGLAEKYSHLHPQERCGLLKKSRDHLNELLQKDDAPQQEVATAVVDATRDATLANRATLMEALRQGNDQARTYTQQMVTETRELVKTTARLVDSAIYNDDLVLQVIAKSDGTVVQHMTRVFLLGLEFLLFYNRQVIMRGIASKIRVRFRSTYRPFYHSLLPHLHEDQITLEHVFYGGMKALDEAEINAFATGFLVHDVGKAEDIEYHEGEAGFDRATVERHVKIGYKAVMEKTNYPREAALITGYHHEYYGHPQGYGYFREFLKAYKRARPEAVQDYIMSYTMEPLIDYQVLSYFPAKMLEIVDVYDSLTDPNRKYRSPLKPAEALAMIKTEFIEKSPKIDPILFDIFLGFLKTKLVQPRR
ncbi:HD-GYP domain, c-di-GMP phosphodiesterase class II (or its inactivated variant) [Alkalispirochaeta americana]|uniref:HD-GYP domain, c-di-GMP phosphodiesterase class II (Or its inactivated variant) n=1 Tax=Alkalispirochaeta americana TaxID=159291 RepID=A0A1N6V8M0_9SPIO|nr:metal-dependent phosphohydrolase [Alkalispirochaeta americana]SIQ74098.1 HD-GYP domain, c-di-GMP phosphodiesterase class II (or its inactivated variant) [Alkalispirochaeta americana]